MKFKMWFANLTFAAQCMWGTKNFICMIWNSIFEAKKYYIYIDNKRRDKTKVVSIKIYLVFLNHKMKYIYKECISMICYNVTIHT